MSEGLVIVKKTTTTQGDTWDTIAKREIGNERYFLEILKANPDYKELEVFSAGLAVNIPEVEKPIPEELPPWKR